MFLAKPLFAGLASKAGSFLLSKAKNFLGRNIQHLRDGAISILQGKGLQDTLKQTASKVMGQQQRNINKVIQQGSNKLKKMISKRGSDIKSKFLNDMRRNTKDYRRYKQNMEADYDNTNTIERSLKAVPQYQNRYYNNSPNQGQYQGIEQLFNNQVDDERKMEDRYRQDDE